MPMGNHAIGSQNSNGMLCAVSGATHISAVVWRSWTSKEAGHVHECCVDEKVDVDQAQFVRKAFGATMVAYL